MKPNYFVARKENSIKYNLNLLNNEIGEQVEKDYLDLKELIV